MNKKVGRKESRKMNKRKILEEDIQKNANKAKGGTKVGSVKRVKSHDITISDLLLVIHKQFLNKMFNSQTTLFHEMLNLNNVI